MRTVSPEIARAPKPQYSSERLRQRIIVRYRAPASRLIQRIRQISFDHLLHSFFLPSWARPWLVPLLLAVFGGMLRFWRLSEPHDLVFDETYYVKDAYAYLQSGYERSWEEQTNPKFIQGDFSGLQNAPEFVVHPPVGKWLIAWGLGLFGGDNGFGWRFTTALVGTCAIALLALIAHQLLHSPFLGALAGLFLAVDGHAIVHSRTALLDNFVMVFALAAFGALLLDKSQLRKRLLQRLQGCAGSQRSEALRYGPFLGLRLWRLAAGILLGLCLGTKWSGIFFIAAFGLLSVAWDAAARRQVGVRHWLLGTLIKDSPGALLTIVPVAFLTYIGTWTGWFLSTQAYDRFWASSVSSWIPAMFRSLAEYHRSMYVSSLAITAPHPYQSSPWSWFFMIRPTSFFASYPKEGCGEDSCAQVVTSLGNPLIWWAGAAALLFLMAYGIVFRDGRAGAILVAWAAGFVPWLFYTGRTIFFFYAIAYEPYMILAIVFALGLLLRRHHTSRSAQLNMLMVGIFLILVLLLSAFFLPVWTAEVTTYEQWRWRMWLPSWI